MLKTPISITNLVRITRLGMIGVKFNKERDWVGETIGIYDK